MSTPSYDFQNFKSACKIRKNVYVWRQAKEDADRIFNLKSTRNLLEFISNDGLEDLSFINKTEWKENPDKSNDIMIDAYHFRTAYMLGYIAFFYNAKQDKWIIKSFKLSEQCNPTMGLAFKSARLLSERKKGDSNE